ncbi:thiol peroxidase [candidate division WOR-3 bacterium]|nr:thiol peroxidase [candidate division WOR-3 bacterium]
MEERKGEVTVQGNPVTLIGPKLTVGQIAPDFSLVGTDMKPVTREQFKGKILVLLSVPSLDTPVCDLEARKFNQEAANLGDDVVVLLVSMDLPFAQKRWCGAAGVERVITASDHRDASFGTSYGVLIKELRLLARAVFVVDREGIIRYIQVVSEAGKEPDYQAVLEAVRKIK